MIIWDKVNWKVVDGTKSTKQFEIRVRRYLYTKLYRQYLKEGSLSKKDVERMVKKVLNITIYKDDGVEIDKIVTAYYGYAQTF